MSERTTTGKYVDPSGPKRRFGCSQERVEEQLRIALDGHSESELWGDNGLIAATMRAANSVEEIARERDEALELARELRDALTGMEKYYRQHIIQGSLFLQVHAALTKAKEVLP